MRWIRGSSPIDPSVLVRSLARAATVVALAAVPAALAVSPLTGTARAVAVGGAVAALLALTLRGRRRPRAHPAVRAHARPLITPVDPRLGIDAESHRFTRRLERALAAAPDEPAAVRLALAATEHLGDIAPAEVLLAAGRGPLVQIDETGPDGEGPGCPVIEPDDCPAMRAGATQTYDRSDALDACPHLRRRIRPEATSATCVPFGVAGDLFGVLHRTGPVDATNHVVTERLDIVAARLDARLGQLRSEVPVPVVSRDPLTGLPDRRAAEARLEGFRRELTPYTLAVVDIDHLRDYESTYGDAVVADALVCVSRLLRDSVRSQDLVARADHGTFLVVLAVTDAAVGRTVIERCRADLGDRLAAIGAPPLTLSAGVAPSTPGSGFDVTVNRASDALAAAKRAGRDRVVLADEVPAIELDDHTA
ncbi:MAG: GGDEF domain-containing protein [Actinomycetota bacterium]|nr:GGDEF domain-containing protein [Actinomycetota bacterium]